MDMILTRGINLKHKIWRHKHSRQKQSFDAWRTSKSLKMKGEAFGDEAGRDSDGQKLCFALRESDEEKRVN